MTPNIQTIIARSTLKVSILYILFGFLWILGSDTLLEFFVSTDALTPQQLFYITLSKGLCFVLVTGLIFYVADTISIKKMGKEVAKTKNNLYALINSNSDLMWSVNKDLKITYANAAFKQTMSAILGKEYVENDAEILKHFSDGELLQWHAYFVKALQGDSFCVDEKYQLANKSIRFGETCFNPIMDENGEIIGVGCYSRDITQRKRNELRIEEQNKKLNEIAWMQSHKVRGPVSTIMAINNMFNRKNPADADNVNLLNMMDVATKKLDDAIGEIVEKSYEPVHTRFLSN